MSDDTEMDRISAMSESELLDYVMENPNYLMDSYYRCFGIAMSKRHEQLLSERTK